MGCSNSNSVPTRIDVDLIYEINRVRKNPSSYLGIISKNKSKVQNSKDNNKTKEGVAAYEEAEQFLKNYQESQNELMPSSGLFKIAQGFLKEFKNYKIDKVDNIDIKKIIDKCGRYSGNLYKLIVCGGEEPESVVSNLIVCDGDQNREQRNKLFDKTFKKIGIAHGEHPIYKYASIFILSTDFDNINDQDDELDI